MTNFLNECLLKMTKKPNLKSTLRTFNYTTANPYPNSNVLNRV